MLLYIYIVTYLVKGFGLVLELLIALRLVTLPDLHLYTIVSL
jgi:hypothetical protein